MVGRSGQIFLQALEQRLSGGDGETPVDPLDWMRGLAKTAEGYLAVWDRVIEGVSAGAQGDSFVEELKRRRGDARKRLMELGLELETPLERAFKRAYELEQGEPPINGALGDYLQEKYDQCGIAAEVLRGIVARFRVTMESLPEEGMERAELSYLMEAVDRVSPTDAAKRLAHRGVVIDGERGMSVGRLKSGDSEQGQRARRAALEKRARLGMMKLEAYRIKEAKARQYPYAGRRHDVKDYKGHHPYVTSMAAANYARILSCEGERWRYGDRAYFFKVEEGFEARFSKEYVYLEPDFSIYDEHGQLVRIIVLADGNRVERSFHGNSWSELEALREMCPQLEIEMVNEHDHYQGTERLAREGFNIQNAPQRFALPGECSCPLCSGSRVHPDFEQVPGHLGAVGRRH